MKDLTNKILAYLPPLTQKTSYYVLGGAVAFALLFDYLFVMSFQIRALRSLNPKIATLGKDLKDIKYHFERVSIYEAEAARLRERFSKVKTSILTREEIPMILENISRIASGLGVQIDQIMPLKESEEQMLESDEAIYFAVPIFIKAEGGYHAFGKFFNRIEEDQTFMNIQDFDIVKSSTHPRKQMSKFVIIIFVKEEK
ncbi:MAG: type 4a pilus biogenesis protein PilO [Candidatus Aceula meridiana]|nr:type 4a pilus biogenesis protein PilO [Candidatus Aceula meridiana]